MKVNPRKDEEMVLATEEMHKSESALYVITQKGCVNYPAARAVIQEAVEGTSISVKIVDL